MFLCRGTTPRVYLVAELHVFASGTSSSTYGPHPSSPIYRTKKQNCDYNFHDIMLIFTMQFHQMRYRMNPPSSFAFRNLLHTECYSVMIFFKLRILLTVVVCPSYKFLHSGQLHHLSSASALTIGCLECCDVVDKYIYEDGENSGSSLNGFQYVTGRNWNVLCTLYSPQAK